MVLFGYSVSSSGQYHCRGGDACISLLLGGEWNKQVKLIINISSRHGC